VYIADTSNNQVEKVTAAGVLSILAGTGTAGTPTPGLATGSKLNSPSGVAVGSSGNVYIADTGNNQIEKVTSGGVLSIVAGTGASGPPTPGPARSSKLHYPHGVTVDSQGNLYISDTANHEIDKVTSAGTLSIFAGTGESGPPIPGPATTSDLNNPDGVSVDSLGNVYIADNGNHQVEKVTPAGVLSIYAGTGYYGLPTLGPATDSKLRAPSGVGVDSSGNVYIVDTASSEVVEVGGPRVALVPPVFTADSPPSALVGSVYSYVFAASGSPAPTFSVGAGALPAGLGLDSAGVLSGTLLASGTFSVTATNTAGTVSSGPLTVTAISAGVPPVFTADSPPAALVGSVYSYVFAASGSPAPTFSVGAGALPAGLGLDSAGVLSGTLTASGTFSVTATNTAGAASSGSVTVTANPIVVPPVSISTGGATAATPGGLGWWALTANGTLSAHGNAADLGSENGVTLNAAVMAINSTSTGNGYWLAASDGGVFTFGDARFLGSMGGTRLNQPVVGMARTVDNGGYWLLASDGGVFAFGDAVFYGSTGGQHLNQPMVGIAATASGRGYWMVASDGGIFAFGDAAFHGSMGAVNLNKNVVGVATTPDGSGYWLIGGDGGVFTFGDARFYGSLGSSGTVPIVGIIANGTLGYRLIGATGDAHGFGTNP
jgi:hypothetical protein